MNEIIIKTTETFLKKKKSLLSALEYPTWNYITQTFDYIRAYEDALIFAANLLQELEKNRDKFSQKKYEENIFFIYFFVFTNLDKLDRWEDYLDSWERVLRNVKVGHKYPLDIKREVGITPYIIKESNDAIYVHFLWSLKPRKELIERKLEKKRKGKKIGNLLHAQQSELTTEEIKERFEWIVNFRSTGVYDYDPPASRQKERKRKENRETINIEPVNL
ncbi:MAG: hypothetical protein KKD35_05335 [Elusimicrobia bacterium]|nr:hypothetical protein [Elusimicrobiota bacterium]